MGGGGWFWKRFEARVLHSCLSSSPFVMRHKEKFSSSSSPVHINIEMSTVCWQNTLPANKIWNDKIWTTLNIFWRCILLPLKVPIVQSRWVCFNEQLNFCRTLLLLQKCRSLYIPYFVDRLFSILYAKYTFKHGQSLWTIISMEFL